MSKSVENFQKLKISPKITLSATKQPIASSTEQLDTFKLPTKKLSFLPARPLIQSSIGAKSKDTTDFLASSDATKSSKSSSSVSASVKSSFASFKMVEAFSEEYCEKFIKQNCAITDENCTKIDSCVVRKNEIITTNHKNLKSMQIKEEIGQGTYGKVFLVKNVANNGSLCVKYVNSSRPWELVLSKLIKTRLENTKTCENMRNAFIEIYHCFTMKSKLIYVMDYVSGGSVYDLVEHYRKKMQSLNDEILALLVYEICAIVFALKEIQIVHCDIRPDNLLLQT